MNTFYPIISQLPKLLFSQPSLRIVGHTPKLQIEMQSFACPETSNLHIALKRSYRDLHILSSVCANIDSSVF